MGAQARAADSKQSLVSSRLRIFLKKPWRGKISWVAQRGREALLRIPRPVRLPFGAYFFRRHDALGLNLARFETRELAFASRFIRPGMTVLDVGAHQGLYTILASRRVGPTGRVFAFEPSPRERRALRVNLALNFSRNVTIEALALGSQETTADLFVVQGSQTGCNSLRPPDVFSPTKAVRVHVSTLDRWLPRNRVFHVDFIKLDVEGAELEVLKGAAALLQNRPRPVILAEVQDVRTVPWGYRAKEVLTLLCDAGYTWFRLLPNGSLDELDLTPEEFDGDFVACPVESVDVLDGSIFHRQ